MAVLSRRLARPALLALVLFIAALAFTQAGCTADAEVRKVDGKYRQLYVDEDRGGYYYVDRGKKVHVDSLPPSNVQREFSNEKQQKYYGPGPEEAVLPGW